MVQKKRIILHIGHGKTGTSATQHLLAKNSAFLREKGILYPDHPSSKLAMEGRITSGNVSLTPGNNENWISTQIIDRVKQKPNYDAYVFSNEHLFWVIGSTLPQISDLMLEYEIKIIQSVREPTEMLTSFYCQAIKNDGYFFDLLEYEPLENHIVHAETNLRKMKQHGIHVDTLNYSFLKRGISEEIFRLIGLTSTEVSSLNLTSAKRVNRSLTLLEMQMIKMVNKHVNQRVGISCSNALVEKLPDVQAEEVDVPFDVFERFRNRIINSVEYVNELLPVGQKLKVELPLASDVNSKLSNEQIEVFVKAFANAERDHVIRYPWKYVRMMIRERLR